MPAAQNSVPIYVHPNITTTFFVSGTNMAGCSASDSITIVVNPNPIITITPNTATICNGESVSLLASGANSYNWNNSTSLSSTNTASTIASTIATTTYTVTGTNIYGCTTDKNITVTVNQLPNINVNNATICAGNAANLAATGAVSYLWSPTASLSSNSGNNDTATPTITTLYTIIGSTLGCNDTTTATVIVNALPLPPAITALSDTAFCIGDSVIINSNIYNAYLWSTGQTSNSIIVFFNGVYTARGIDVNGCISLPSNAITVLTYALPPAPILSTNEPTIICANDSILLVAFTNVYNPIWHWLPLSIILNNDSIYVNTSNTYAVQITDTNGCVSAFSNNINITTTALPGAPQILASGSISFCDGDSVSLSVNIVGTYLWNYPTTNGSVLNNITVSTSGTYTVNILDTCNITHTPTINVKVFPNPVAKFGLLDSAGCAPFFAQFINQSTNAATYQWSVDGNTLVNDFEPQHTYDIPGKYSVQLIATSADGCTDTKSVINIVNVGDKPIVDFEYSPDSALINETTPSVLFASLSQNADSLLWLCNDYNLIGGGVSFEAILPDTGKH